MANPSSQEAGPNLLPVCHTFIWSISPSCCLYLQTHPESNHCFSPPATTRTGPTLISHLDYCEPFQYLSTPPLPWATVRPAVRMSLNTCQSHHGTPHSNSSQGAQKAGQSARISHRALQGPALMLPGITSYCFAPPFTPATEASLLLVEHIRHAAQIVCNLHSSTPSLLNTLPLLAKPLTSLSFH